MGNIDTFKNILNTYDVFIDKVKNSIEYPCISNEVSYDINLQDIQVKLFFDYETSNHILCTNCKNGLSEYDCSICDLIPSEDLILTSIKQKMSNFEYDAYKIYVEIQDIIIVDVCLNFKETLINSKVITF